MCVFSRNLLGIIIFNAFTIARRLKVGANELSTAFHRPIHTCQSAGLASVATMEGNHNCRRLLQIKGYMDRQNDMLFCGNTDSPAESNVIYFGGDIQEYSELMKAHRDNHRYEKWNLEATAQLLQRRFPMSHIWVIKPKEMSLKTFSVYSNFVNFPDFAAPVHSDDYGSWHHLLPLLNNAADAVSAEVKSDGGVAGDCPASPVTFEKPLIMVGFSKGCVVLNQLIYELGVAKADSSLNSLVGRVHEMYWLDGGHNGGSDTYITKRSKLESLVGTNIHVLVHVTPYQMSDTMRAWLRKEKKKFVAITKELGVKVTDTLHFEGEERNIHQHFAVLERF